MAGDEHHSVAVPPGAVAKQPVLAHHRVDQSGRRVQTAKCRRSGSTVGSKEEQAQHELRQAQSGTSVLLRQEHHPKGSGTKVRVPIRVFSGDRQDREQDSFPRQDGGDADVTVPFPCACAQPQLVDAHGSQTLPERRRRSGEGIDGIQQLTRRRTTSRSDSRPQQARQERGGLCQRRQQRQSSAKHRQTQAQTSPNRSAPLHPHRVTADPSLPPPTQPLPPEQQDPFHDPPLLESPALPLPQRVFHPSRRTTLPVSQYDVISATESVPGEALYYVQPTDADVTSKVNTSPPMRRSVLEIKDLVIKYGQISRTNSLLVDQDANLQSPDADVISKVYTSPPMKDTVLEIEDLVTMFEKLSRDNSVLADEDVDFLSGLVRRFLSLSFVDGSFKFEHLDLKTQVLETFVKLMYYDKDKRTIMSRVGQYPTPRTNCATTMERHDFLYELAIDLCSHLPTRPDSSTSWVLRFWKDVLRTRSRIREHLTSILNNTKTSRSLTEVKRAIARLRSQMIRPRPPITASDLLVAGVDSEIPLVLVKSLELSSVLLPVHPQVTVCQLVVGDPSEDFGFCTEYVFPSILDDMSSLRDIFLGTS